MGLTQYSIIGGKQSVEGVSSMPMQSWIQEQHVGLSVTFPVEEVCEAHSHGCLRGQGQP